MLIGQIWICLLSAFGLGLFVGWLWKQLTISQRQSHDSKREELLTYGQERMAKEREITATHLTTLRTQAEAATATLQKQGSELAKLDTELSEKITTLSNVTAHATTLQERLTETEAALQQNLHLTRSLESEVHTLRSELSTRDQDLRQLLLQYAHNRALSSRAGSDSFHYGTEHSAEQIFHFQSLLQEKEEAISHLQTQITALAPLNDQLIACTQSLRETEASYQNLAREKDAEITHLQTELQSLQVTVAENTNSEAKIAELKTRHHSALREKEATMARLQARIAGLELLLHRQNERISVPTRVSPSIHHRTPTSFPRELQTATAYVPTSDLIEIKGLNIQYLSKLREIGITTRAALLKKGMTQEDREAIAARTGIPAGLLLQWVRHADLLRLTGVSGVYAELLDAAGVDSVSALTKCTAETLHQKFLDVNAAKRLSRILPILAQIRDWIEQARHLPRFNEEVHLASAN
jgi:hypothetical protein